MAQQNDFAPVGRYSGGKIGSFTLIHPNWALTAAHVVSDSQGNLSTFMGTLTVGGISRRATEFIVPRGENGNPSWNGDIGAGLDIALVHFDDAITSITPASIYTGFQEFGKTITMVGYGHFGNGLEGVTSASTFTKRAGENVVDELFTMRNGATALRWDFDDPAGSGVNAPNHFGGSNTPLNLEYQIAPGDSGGGSFIQENGLWYLAGVHSGTYDFFDPPGTNDSHTYGDAALITRVAAYQDFIFSHIPDLTAIPEPANLALLLLAGGLVKRHRRA